MESKTAIPSPSSSHDEKFSEGSNFNSSPHKSCKQKAKLERNFPIKGKITKQLCTLNHAQNTFENLNEIYLKQAVTQRALPVKKDKFDSRSNAPKISKSLSKPKEKNERNKKEYEATDTTESALVELRNKPSLLKVDMNFLNPGSLTDLTERDDESFVTPLSQADNIFPLTSSQFLTYENSLNKNHQKNYVDFMKDFDMIRNSMEYKQWENTVWSSQLGVESTAPKLSTSKPFLLERKTYSCGILSLNDNGDTSAFPQNNDVSKDLKTAPKYESEDTDYFYSSGSENLNICDCGCASDDENVIETFLNVKQPIRVKYVDESTSKSQELLIYTNEYFENINREKDSKREIFEIILKQSVNYEGENLRIILNIKEFFSNLRKEKIHKADGKSKKCRDPGNSVKLIKPQRSAQSTPCYHNRQENGFKKEMLNTGRKSTHQKFCQKRNVDGCQPLEGNACPLGNNTPDSKIRQKLFHDISIKRAEAGDGKRSTTALKRINFEEIIASDFKYYFQTFAKLGGRLKSGAVISRVNSHLWFKKCGIIFDTQSLKIADDCFSTIAKKKLVLNISDYLQYLVLIARKHNAFFVDVVQQLMKINPQSLTKLNGELEMNRSAYSVSELLNTKRQAKSDHISAKLLQRKA